MLARPIGRNVPEYVDEMVVTSEKENQHVADLEELFTTMARYNLKLNPEQCVFGVEEGKFLGFLLIKRGIEANPNKCATVIKMRSSTNVKEVQHLTGRMAALSRFLSASGDKGYPYFQCLKKNNHFVCFDECERAFIKLNEYLASPPVLGKPILGVPIQLYFLVKDRAISSVILKNQEKIQKPIYFMRKVLQRLETRYQATEKASMTVVFTARRLRHYFQSFTVIIMTYLPIRNVLQKPNIAGRMVRWVVELFEFDI